MAVPAIPSNFMVQQGNGQVFVSWGQVVGVTSYSLQRSVDNVTFTTVASPTTPSYLDAAVTVGIQYYYQVASVNGASTSSYTTSQSIVPAVSGSLSLGQLRLMAQQRADRVASNFVTTSEWNTYINQSYFELYDILVQKYGNEYFVASPPQFGTTGAAAYPLPNGLLTLTAADGVTQYVPPPFFKLLGVDLGLSSGNNAWITLKKFEFIKRNSYIYPQLTANLLGVAGIRYRLLGNNVEFIPSPQANQIIRLWYIPRLTMLLQDTDICDGVSGWTEYIIIDAAIKALQKEESDVTVLGMQKMAMLQRIESAAENRDAGEPETISDTRGAVGPWGTGNGDGQFGGY